MTTVFSALSFMCWYLWKMSVMEELSDSKRLIDLGIWLIIVGVYLSVNVNRCIVLFFVRCKCAFL